MDIQKLREAQARFELKMGVILSEKKETYDLRDDFAKYFSLERIQNMSIEQYALGHEHPKKGYNFCYTIERQLDNLGRILGARSDKFGIYFGKTKSDPTNKYRIAKKFGNNKDEAFNNVKAALVNLIKDGKQEDIDSIVNNPLSPMFKGKILSTFFPDRYLNVFSDEHLEYFLVQLNLDSDNLIWKDAVLKREALVAFKNSDKIMRNWPLDLFMNFLYSEYPGRPPKGEANNKDILADYREPKFPSTYKAEFIDLTIGDTPELPNKQSKTYPKKNPDYDKEAKLQKSLGNRGEKIVIELEKEYLISKGRKDLAKKVEKTKFDYFGYDIDSFEPDGTSKQIEVKATKSKLGQANFFLSSNELSKAQELKNYYIYMVYDILTQSPKVWRIANPFKPENKKVLRTPISYRVQINVKDLS